MNKKLTGLFLAATALAATPALAILYQWQIRPNIGDSYLSVDMPQPVCALDPSGNARIYTFTNFDNFGGYNNASSNIRVGAINVPADSYVRISTNVPGDPHTLPGRRWGFATASVTVGAQSMIYLFGGRNGSGDFDDVYSYSPATGFSPGPIATIPAIGGIAGPRSGAVAVPAYGKIYLIGGLQGNSALNQVLEFNPATNQFTARAPLPVAFHGARAMTKAVGPIHYIYLVGGRTTPNGAPGSAVYRYDPNGGTGTGATVQIRNPDGTPLTLPPDIGYPMISWDPSGAIRIVAPRRQGSWGWSQMEVWTLTDTYGNVPQNGRAVLTPAPYPDPARARDMAGLVKCGSNTYLAGGNYGHGPSLQDRSRLLDRLGTALIRTNVQSTLPRDIRVREPQ